MLHYFNDHLPPHLHMITTANITDGFALLVIIGQAMIGLYVLGLPWRKKALRGIYDFVGEYALLGGFLVAAMSVVGSLYLSEVAKYVPCELCWYQRVLMYPQAVLLGLALMKKNRDVALQVLVLSVVGLLIAIYHVYLQSGGTALVPCSTVALAVPCGVKNFQEFGYVTIPVMSLTGFTMLIIAMVLHRQQHKEIPTPIDE